MMRRTCEYDVDSALGCVRGADARGRRVFAHARAYLNMQASPGGAFAGACCACCNGPPGGSGGGAASSGPARGRTSGAFRKSPFRSDLTYAAMVHQRARLRRMLDDCSSLMIHSAYCGVAMQQ